jgi:predicted nucleic acid-binding protein
MLIAAMIEAHPAHERALARLQQVKQGVDVGLVAAHSLAEVYAILTRLPGRPRITPARARQLIQSNILGSFEIIPLAEEDYVAVIDHLADHGITGGATYDALILQAAARSNVDQIVTLNERDFRRVYPALADRIVAP